MKKRNTGIILSMAVLLLFAAIFFGACGSKVTLTFDMNGASAENVVIEAEKGEQVESPAAPVREGFSFQGWMTEKDGNTPFDGKAPEKNATYYAKWEEAYTLTLDLGGGSYAGRTTLWLAEGENLSEALKDIVPSMDGLSFGGWFTAEGAQLSASAKMPASAMTLTAKYAADYTVEIYLQNITGTNYVRSYENDVFGKEIFGKTYTPDAPPIAHFTCNAAHTETVNTLMIGKGENTFRFYYDREFYSVEYDANAPLGTFASGKTKGASARYEGAVTLSENAFSVRGYRFAGWSKTQDGAELLLPAEEIKVEANMRLFAVWDRGYTDRYGSSDIIYFPRTEEDVAILERGGHEFRGERTGDSFSFKISANNLLEGRVFGTKFSYKNKDIAGEYVLSDVYGTIDENVTLTIDEYMGAVYKSGGSMQTGAVEYSADGDYVFTADGGDSFHTLFSKNGGLDGEDIFLIAGAEAGEYMDFVIIDAETGMGMSNGDLLILSGYGLAALYKATAMGYIVFDGRYTVEGSLTSGNATFFKIVCMITDDLGLLGTPGTYAYYLYTMPLEADYDGYVFADATVGEFAGEGELTLDGFGFFADSAVYTENGETYTGTYSYESDYKSGTVITMAARDERGNVQKQLYFNVDLNRYTYTRLPDNFRKDYKEYYMLNEGFDFPLLVIYEETLEGGKKAELWASQDEGATVRLAATGYCTSVALSPEISLYTFTRTEAHNGYDEFVARQMTFFFTTLFGSGDLRAHEVYCMLSYNDEVYYEVITLTDGGEIWSNTRVSILGSGSLYFPKGRDGGEVIEGSFSTEENPYFGGNYGEFIYGSQDGNVTLQYKLSAGADGKLAGTPTERAEIILYIYWRDPETNYAEYVNDLVLDGNGNAAFNDDHGYGKWQPGSYSQAGNTVFGGDIYELTVGGEVRFRFLIYLMRDAAGNTLPLYFIFNGDAEGEYPLTGGGEFVMDGFCVASYTDAEGNYHEGTFSLNDAGNLVYFTANDGTSVYISLSENGRATALDEAFGEYYLVDSSYNQINYMTVNFDGRGNLTVKSPNGSAGEGWYEAIKDLDSQFMIHCDIGRGMGAYRVQLEYLSQSEQYICILFDDKYSGEFIDEQWNVLRLDGYGNGSFSSSGAGEYAVLDEDLGFLSFLGEEGDEVYLLLDFEDRSFELIDYSKFGYVYFSEKLDYISFGADGIVRVGNSSGFYFVKGDKAYIYLYSYTSENFTKYELPAPTGSDEYSYNGNNYYLWNGGDLRIGGKVEFLDKDGEPSEKHPALSGVEFVLTPTVDRFYNLEASFVIERENYGGFVFNFYTNGEPGPRVSYDGIDYFITFDYHGTAATSSFTVDAGYTEVVLMDYYSSYRDEEGGHRGGMITRTSIGFGPYVLEKPTYSGKFLYLNPNYSQPATPISFENVPYEDLVIVGNRSGLGNCYEVVFGFGGKTYAVDFYETYAEEIGACIVLQSFYEYEAYGEELNGYRVGLKYLLYSNVANTPGYGDDKALGKVCAATLFGGDGVAIVSIDNGILLEGNGVWIIDSGRNAKGGYQGYVLTFTYGQDGKVASAGLGKYDILSVANSDYLFYLAINADGNIAKVLACAYNSNGSFTWMTGGHDLTCEEETDTYTFRGFAGKIEWKVTVRFNRGEDDGKGNPTFTCFVKEEKIS